MLVPPAPSAFSNSELLILPSPSVSSCENRLFSASDRLVGADAVVAVDDWLCAASRALMVAGDSCENPLEPEAGVELPEGAVLPERSNGLAGAWLKPVDGGDENFDEVSEWRASSADDTAPRASSMTKLRQMPHGGLLPSRHKDQQTPCHREKADKTWGFGASTGPTIPAIDAAAAEFSALDARRGPHCPRGWRVLPEPSARFESGFRKKRTCPGNLRHAPSSSRRRSWLRISPNWASMSAPSIWQAPTG